VSLSHKLLDLTGSLVLAPLRYSPLESRGWCSLLLLSALGGLPAVPVVPVVGLDAGGGLLVLLEPLVLAVRPKVFLDDDGGFGQLLPVTVLFISPVVVLYEDGRLGLGVPLPPPLLAHCLLAPLVRPVSFLNDLRGLKEFSLLALVQREVRQILLTFCL